MVITETQFVFLIIFTVFLILHNMLLFKDYNRVFHQFLDLLKKGEAQFNMGRCIAVTGVAKLFNNSHDSQGQKLFKKYRTRIHQFTLSIFLVYLQGLS